MKLKIEIKNRWTDSVLFEYEKENNTVKETLIKAVKQGAYLRSAYLRSAYLRCADLRGADLHGAYLQGADLQGADLRGAYLQGAYLQGADLQGAYLQGADLQGAYLRGADLQGFKIKAAAVFTGLYTYVVMPYITDENEMRVKMGCHDRSVKEWDENFWNNNREFPNDGSFKSGQRLLAFETAKAWLELASKTLTTFPVDEK